MPLKDQSEYINFLMEQNKTVLAQNEELTKTVAELTDKIEELTKKISELTEQKNKNSNNSSKPPSSDGLKKPNKDRSLREKSNKTQGGQPGHDDSRLKINKENPDEVKKLKPSRCKGCPKCRAFCFALWRPEMHFKVVVAVMGNPYMKKARRSETPQNALCIMIIYQIAFFVRFCK